MKPDSQKSYLEQAGDAIKGKTDGEALGAMDKILAASAGGALATWNQPIEGKLP